jgi:spore germination cell wall hydrolase CwlJ-like protein
MKTILQTVFVALFCGLAAACTASNTTSNSSNFVNPADPNVVASGIISENEAGANVPVPSQAPRVESASSDLANSETTDVPDTALALAGSSVDAPAVQASAALEATQTVVKQAVVKNDVDVQIDQAIAPKPDVKPTDQANVQLAVVKPSAPAENIIANDEENQDSVVEDISAKPRRSSNRERDCLMRAMYFESNRSSPEGLLAVGTVVMNRVANGAWGRSICGVVGAKRQFAPGVMSRKMQGNLSDLTKLADKIIAGKRHPKISKRVMFFHTAGLKFPYRNMRYVHVAGGNAFYYKASRRG